MRISDWSSDVCSSDLKDSGKLGVDRKTEHAKYPVQTCALYGQVGIAAHQPGHLLVAPGGGLDGPFGNVQPGQDQDRKSVEKGKSVSVRVDLGGRRIIKKKKRKVAVNRLNNNVN